MLGRNKLLVYAWAEIKASVVNVIILCFLLEDYVYRFQIEDYVYRFQIEDRKEQT